VARIEERTSPGRAGAVGGGIGAVLMTLLIAGFDMLAAAMEKLRAG
jgi:hypothetical protein